MCKISKCDGIPPTTPAVMKRDALIIENLPFAYRLAGKYRGLGLDRDDLQQLAAVGLIRAADEFESDAGAAFTTFAVYFIKAEILRGLENQGRTIRLPSHLLAKIRRYRRFTADFLREYGRELTDDEAAEALGIDARELSAMHRAYLSVLSLDQPIDGEDGETLTLADTVVTDEDMSADIADADERRCLQRDMERALARLPEDERAVLMGMFYRNQTREQLAEQLESSEQAVTNARARGLRHLREPWARMILAQYRADIIDGCAYRSSFAAWEAVGSSSTERAAIKLVEMGENGVGSH